MSHCLNAAEINYNTTEKELLAIVYSISKCRIYLTRNSFVLITDHEALTFLNTTPFRMPRLVRWSIYLQQYDFSVQHCTGRDNIVADFFSRNPVGRFEPENNPHRLIIASLTCDLELTNEKKRAQCNIIYKLTRKYDELPADMRKNPDNLAEFQREDPHLVKIIAQAESGHDSKRYKIHKGILFHYRRRQIAPNVFGTYIRVDIPVAFKRLIELTHEKLGHPGVSKTLAYIKTHFCWDSIHKDVQKYVLSCELCQRVKHANQSMEGEYQMVPATQLSELVAVDFYGPLPRSIGGVEYVLVALDAHSKYVKLYPLKRATTRIALKKIEEQYIPELGKPLAILSDNGTQFTSNLWKSTLQQEGIRAIFSAVRHPQSNPTERVMRELGRLFRTLCSDAHTKWAKYIPVIESFLNVTVHSSTGFPPCKLHFRRRVTEQIDKLISFPPREDIEHAGKFR